MKYLIIIQLIFLVACGGGGGGSSAVASSNPVAVIGDSLSVAVAPYIGADSLAIGGASTVDMIDNVQGKDLSQYTKIYIMAGINDLVVDGWEVDAILLHYSDLIDIVKAKTKAIIIVQSTLPMNDLAMNHKVQLLNKGIQSLSSRKGVKYIDLWVIFLDLDSGLLLYSTDGVHLTPDGYAKWSRYLAEG